MDPNIAPKAIVDPTHDDPSSSISNPVSLPRSWGLATLVQPIMFPQFNIPNEADSKWGVIKSLIEPDKEREPAF